MGFAVGHRQERVIGRAELEDIELDDDVKPANSHIALNVITDDEGTELKIVRHNMPFGEVGKGEYGTYFIGYSRTPEVTERLLATCFSAIRRAIPTAFWTFPPPSPADCFSPPPSTSSTIHRPCPNHQHRPSPSGPLPAPHTTGHSRSAA